MAKTRRARALRAHATNVQDDDRREHGDHVLEAEEAKRPFVDRMARVFEERVRERAERNVEDEAERQLEIDQPDQREVQAIVASRPGMRAHEAER